MFAVLALAVRLVHALYVGVVLVAPFALAASALLPARRRVVRALRLVHLSTVAWAAWQLALGLPCPLTQLEATLAGQPPLDFLPPPSAQPVVACALTVHLLAGLGAQWLAGRVGFGVPVAPRSPFDLRRRGLGALPFLSAR